MTRRWLQTLGGLALLAIGAGAVVVASSLRPVDARVVGANRAVNAGATDARDIGANNSPTLVRNPTRADNLVVANRIDTPSFSCGLQMSFDGGRRWSPGALPFPVGEELPPRCFAPDAAFGPDGTLYVSFVTLVGLGNTPNAVWIASSPDGGVTLSPPARVLGPLAFQVRLVADPRVAGRLYLSWLQASETGTFSFAAPGNPVRVMRSDDGGRRWQQAVTVSSPSRQRLVAPAPALGPDGGVYVLYLDLGDDALDYAGGHEGQGGEPFPGPWSLVLARSTDQGGTWSESVVGTRLVPIERIVVLFPPAPSLAVGQRDGRVFAAFHDGRLGDADVWLWASNDGGVTFAAPTRVNDTRRRDATAQYLPELAVAPGGRVDVLYLDRRSDPGDNVLTEASLQSSFDGGRSFSPRVRLSDRPFSSKIGFGSERGLPDIGSRLGLASGDEAVVAVWTDTRAGTEASNKQDLAVAMVAFPEPSPVGRWLRRSGYVLAASALLLASAAWVPRRRDDAGPTGRPPLPGG